MKYWAMLTVICIILSLSLGNIYITYILHSQDDTIIPDVDVGKLTHQTRISELEKMYYEIENRRLRVDDDDEILGNDNHIIINAYYQTQVMILHEIGKQTKMD